MTVWNRSPEKCKELEGEGASVVTSSADCVAASDITIAMLADPSAALAVAKDAVKGISQGMPMVLYTHKLLQFHAVCICILSRRACAKPVLRPPMPLLSRRVAQVVLG